jgi:diguanylate cyclase (GGDEF)-like protein/PAS domain S-box-containing protein
LALQSAQSRSGLSPTAPSVDAVDVPTKPSRKRGPGRVLLAAAGMYAAVFAARTIDGTVASGLTILYLLPVVLIGVELGWRAGEAAGLFAFALFLAWAPFAPASVPVSAYVVRAAVFVLIGAVAGQLADRLRGAVAEAEASARHFELARDMLCTASLDGYITHINGAWERCLGWTREELTARPFVEFVHPEDRARTEAEAALAADGAATARFTNRYATKDGGWRSLEWRSWVDSERQAIHATARDVTEQLAADAAKREAEERFRRAFDDSATGMAVVGVEGESRDVLLDANDSLGRIFGCPREQLLGTRALSAMVETAQAPALRRGMEDLLRGADAVHRGEYRVERPDGVCVWLDMTASLVRDVDERPLYRLVQVLDVTERKTAEERLRFLADHDPLSGIYNRRRFEAELQRELDLSASRPRRSVLLLLDVDRFKAINDSEGHAAGDVALRGVADALRSAFRGEDVVCRWGGDEFVVALYATGAADARGRVAAALGRAPVACSGGIAATPGAGPDLASLYDAADAALYAVKRAGRGGVALAG